MMREPLPAAPSARQRGMTLIEILVAIVVLSVGLLGLAGLQLKGLQVGQGSTYRWQAAMLAEDMADRMRADRTNALNGTYNVAFNATPTATGAASQTINDWLGRVSLLPTGAASISTGAAGGNPVTIQIQWNDTRAVSGAGQSVPNSTVVTGTFSLATDL